MDTIFGIAQLTSEISVSSLKLLRSFPGAPDKVTRTVKLPRRHSRARACSNPVQSRAVLKDPARRESYSSLLPPLRTSALAVRGPGQSSAQTAPLSSRTKEIVGTTTESTSKRVASTRRPGGPRRASEASMSLMLTALSGSSPTVFVREPSGSRGSRGSSWSGGGWCLHWRSGSDRRHHWLRSTNLAL